MAIHKVYHRQVDLNDPHSEYVDMVALTDYMSTRAEMAAMERRVRIALEGLEEYKQFKQGLGKTERMLKEILGLENEKDDRSAEAQDEKG